MGPPRRLRNLASALLQVQQAPVAVAGAAAVDDLFAE